MPSCVVGGHPTAERLFASIVTAALTTAAACSGPAPAEDEPKFDADAARRAMLQRVRGQYPGTDPERYGNQNDRENDLFEAEAVARAIFESTPIRLQGHVHDLQGNPIAGATVRCSAGQFESEPSESDTLGRFELDGLPRQNALLRVEAEGYEPDLIYVHLAQPTTHEELTLAPLNLTGAAPDLVRFLFGGDTAFGRRFVDPDEISGKLELPRSVDGALIDAEDPLPGTRRAMRHIRPWFVNAHFPVVNLETPVTDTPSEYHTSKEFIFFTLPATLDVFPWLGVRYVSLGNNHVYDYLEDGIEDTLASLQLYGIAGSGAGATPAAAFEPYRVELGGSRYSLVSMTSVSGSQNPPLYVATDDPQKSGAADLRDDDRVVRTLTDERVLGNLPIAQLHTGKEYTFWPSDYARERMSLTVQSGAALVIGHHPHVAQGFAYEDGVLIAASLGNLCFDQARLETMLALLAQVDMQGERVVSARALPIYLEDYTPRPITGALAEHLIRRIGEVSENATVMLDNGAGRVFAASHTSQSTTRTQRLRIELDEQGEEIVDLRQHRRSGESLGSVNADVGRVWAGQDLLAHGDFEDWDVDSDDFELARWDVTGASSFPCLSNPRRGAAALCSVRSHRNGSNSVVAFRNRIRVLGEEWDAPNKDLSLVGYVQGENAGRLWIQAEYYASVGNAEFGGQRAFEHEGGSFGWTWFSADLSMADDVQGRNPLTANPHAVRLFIHQAPPSTGDAVARWDDLAVVSWRDAVALPDGLSLSQPNPIDFLRVRSAPGALELELSWQRTDTAPAPL